MTDTGPPVRQEPDEPTHSQGKTDPSDLRRELQRRWEAGERIEAERLAPPDAPPEVLLPLICAELVLREERGENPTLHEYQHRLPALSDQIARQMALLGLLQANPTESPTINVQGYDVSNHLGQGGMGIVYLARQERFNRLVALKMITAAGLANPDALTRFRTEAQAVARLNHPNIVQVYETGDWQPPVGPPLPYFSMEYCPGGTLAAKLAGTPLSEREAALTCLALARGVAAAHAAGVIHRDLKPANILIAADGQLKISDFGLARQLEDDGQTRTGAIMGTPSYMSPEQAAGHKTCPLTDVYALGTILYEMLVGRPPFKGATVMETLDQVKTQEPPHPGLVRPGLSRDLVTICLKCLHKTPTRRYGSAQELADDLQRFLDGQPIRARPVGVLERGWLWTRRNPALTGLLMVSALAIVLLLGLGLWFSARLGAMRAETNAASEREEAAREQTRAAERLAETQKYFALLNRVRERAISRRVGWREASLNDLRELAQMPDAASQLLDLRSEAARALTSADLTPAGIMWKGFTPHSVAWHPEGHIVALGDRANLFVLSARIALIDVRDPTRVTTLTAPSSAVMGKGGGLVPDVVNYLAFSPDGRWLIAGMRSGRLTRWPLTEGPGKPVSWFKEPFDIRTLVFSPDGSRLYTFMKTKVRAWDTSTWKQTAETDLAGPVYDANYHAGMNALLVEGGGCHILCPHTLGKLRPVRERDFHLFKLLPDGRAIVGAGGLLGLSPIHEADRFALARGDDPKAHPIGYIHPSASPDAALIATASYTDRRGRLWETTTGKVLTEFVIGGGTCVTAFSPSGEHLVVTGQQETLLFRVRRNRALQPVCLLQEPTAALALHPDGRSLLTLSHWGKPAQFIAEMALWPLQEGTTLQPQGRWLRHNVLDDDTTWAALDARYRAVRAVRILHGNTAVQSSDLIGPQQFSCEVARRDISSLALDRQGRAWFTCNDELYARSAELRPLPGWKNALGEALTGLAGLYGLALGQQLIAVGGRDGSIRLFRLDDVNPSPMFSLQVCSDPAIVVALSPDERFALVGSERGTLALVGLDPLQVVAQATKHEDEITGVAFLANGLFASTGEDGTIRVWQHQGEQLNEVVRLRFDRPVHRMVAHPDGVSLLFTRSRERGVQRLRVDLLLDQLHELGLGNGLPRLAPLPLPAPVPLRRPVAEPAKPSAGLRASLYAYPLHEGLATSRIDANIDFDWSTVGPVPGVGPHYYSVRWDGWLKAPQAGTYRLQVEGVEGARLYLDGIKVIDQWPLDAKEPFAAEIQLDGRPRSLRVDINQIVGHPKPRLTWSRVGGFEKRVIAPGYFFTDKTLAEKTEVPAP